MRGPSLVLLYVDRLLSGLGPQSLRDRIPDDSHAAARDRKYVVHCTAAETS